MSVTLISFVFERRRLIQLSESIDHTVAISVVCAATHSGAPNWPLISLLPSGWRELHEKHEIPFSNFLYKCGVFSSFIYYYTRLQFFLWKAKLQARSSMFSLFSILSLTFFFFPISFVNFYLCSMLVFLSNYV